MSDLHKIGDRFYAVALIDKEARDRALHNLRFGTLDEAMRATNTLDAYMEALENAALAGLVDELAS